jgi:Fe-S cluster assembly protein SufD
MTATECLTDLYRSTFEKTQREVGRREPEWLRQVREAAISNFMKVGFPTPGNEEWKHTRVDPISKTFFQTPEYPISPQIVENLEKIPFGEKSWNRLVFLNGYFSLKLSSLKPMPEGVILSSFATALDTNPCQLQSHLARYASHENHPFVALNTSFMKDGAFIFIPRDTIVEEPLNLLFIAIPNGPPTISHPRNLIVAGPNSQVTILESYIGLTDGVYFTNAVTELVLCQEAFIDHYVLQGESKEAFHIATQAIHQDRQSRFSSLSVTVGSALVRSEVHATLDAEEIECTLNGLYTGHAQELVDTHITITHAKPRCTSRQFYKGILDGKATGVFTGNICVEQDAQQTDARQTNNNLLLSKDALIHTTPQLEILADDVTCTHGATVGQLDEEAIFYLRSRGISHETARRMMVSVFAQEIINMITLDPLRRYASTLLGLGILHGTYPEKACDA